MRRGPARWKCEHSKPNAEELLPASRQWGAGLSYTLFPTTWGLILFWFHACELCRHVTEEEVKQELGDKRSKWDTNVWRNDRAVRGDCLISKHYNHKFTNLLHMLLYLRPPDWLLFTVSSRYIPLSLCCWRLNRYIWRLLCRCIFCEWLRCTLQDRKMKYETDGLTQTAINGNKHSRLHW